MSIKIKNIKKILEQDKASLKGNWHLFITEGKKCVDEFKNKETRHKQIPNAFTASRLFAPIFIIPAALSGNLILTGIFACGFAFTDACDGYFARKYDAASEFGRELDPITDKLFAGALLLPLIMLNPVMIINLILEAIIAFINMHSRLNDNKPKTTIIGKIKTGTLSLAMVLSYINIVVAINPTLINTLVAMTACFQITAAAIYYINYKKDEEMKELRNFFELDNDDLVTEEEKVCLNSKEFIINKRMNCEEFKVLTINEKIDKLNDLKQQFIPPSQTLDDTKVYEKK